MDELVTCPYDSAHRISKARMQFHLVKCAEANKNIRKEQCPLHACHKVDSVEYQVGLFLINLISK